MASTARPSVTRAPTRKAERRPPGGRQVHGASPRRHARRTEPPSGKRPPPRSLSGGTPVRSRARALGIGAIALVVLVALVLVVVKLASRTSPEAPTGGAGESAAPASVVRAVTAVPPGIFDAVGTPSDLYRPSALQGQPALSVDSAGATQPGVVYVGAGYCPFCAAERWPLVVALSRFGTFSGLEKTSSSHTDVYPDTATFSFHGATFSSRYVAFLSVELYGSQPGPDGKFTPLENPTAMERTLLGRYDAPPYTETSGAIPFLDIANKYLVISAQYSPQVLSDLSADQIASDLSNPSSPVTQDIMGSANYLTAAICSATGDQPQGVCSDPAVAAAAQKLG